MSIRGSRHGTEFVPTGKPKVTTMVDTSVALRLIQGKPWHHDFEIVPGVRTHGSYNPIEIVERAAAARGSSRDDARRCRRIERLLQLRSETARRPRDRLRLPAQGQFGVRPRPAHQRHQRYRTPSRQRARHNGREVRPIRHRPRPRASLPHVRSVHGACQTARHCRESAC